VSDHTLENAVMQALADDRLVHPDEIAVQAIDDDELHAADIDVECKDGDVTLSGLVEFAGNRDRAERVALGVAGVSHVRNRLKVLVPVSEDDAMTGSPPRRRGA
jgi:Asp/Glu/hydantoin racemase